MDQTEHVIRCGDDLVEAPQMGEWREYDEMVTQLRSWVEARGISYATLDELAGLAKGHSGKLLGGGQIKRFSAFSLIAMMTTLGLKCQFVEDPEMVEQMRPHWENATQPRGELAGKLA